MSVPSNQHRIQALYDASCALLGGVGGERPSDEAQSRIGSILDAMQPCDVGLDAGVIGKLMQESGSDTPHTCIYRDHKFSIDIFIFSPGSSIPLHDHPNMTVFTKVLHGSLRVFSCDFTCEKNTHAKVALDTVLEAPVTSVLYPDEGNLHMFEADSTSGCVILDLITPPYDGEERNCTYYKHTHVSGNSEESIYKLEEDHDITFYTSTFAYKGPRLVRA